MNGTLGQISITLLLNLKEFAAGNKTAVTTLQNTEKIGVQSNQRLGASFTSFLKGLGLVTLGWAALKNGILDSVKAYLASEDVNKKLLAALDGNVKKMKELEAVADRLQEVTIFDDETIKEGMTFLAMQDRTQEQIKKTTEAAVDYAAVTGKDLPTAMKELNMTYEGNIGRLGRLDARFKELTPEQLKNGAAIDLISEKYKGFAEIVGNTTEGKIRKFQNAMDEMQEGIGKGLIEKFSEDFEDLSSSILGASGNMKVIGEHLGKILTIFIGMGPAVRAFLIIFKELKYQFQLIVPLLTNFAVKLLSLPSKLPIIGGFFNKLKDFAEEYAAKLIKIIGLQNEAFHEGKGITDPTEFAKGYHIGKSKNPMDETAQGSDKSKDISDATGKLKEEKEELDKIEQLREDISKLEAEHIKLLTKYDPKSNYIKDHLKQIDELKAELKKLLAIEEEYQRVLAGRGANGTQNDRASGTSKPGARPEASLEPDEDAWKKHWMDGINAATQIINILNRKPETLFQSFMQILAIAQIIATLVGGAAIGGPFGMIVGLFGALGGIFGLERGGDASSNRPYIVGEKGRELFVPSTSGIVIPNWITEAIKKGGGNFSGASKYLATGGFAHASGGGGGSITIINTGEMSEGISTRVIRKGMPGYNLIMQKKGKR